jgi:pimeloyl-ACP methyl ester carboxylesterase
LAAPPPVLGQLIERFDASAFDAPTGRARLRLRVDGAGEWDFVIRGGSWRLESADRGLRADARLWADRATWARVARDLRGGMNAFRGGRLQIRDDLHLGVGFLAATSGSREPGRLVLARVRTAMGNIAVARAGHPDAEPVVMLHGLGGTKASFLPTVAALADEYRVHAIDLPGFGDSVKPWRASYDPQFFARAVCGFMDACGIERAHLIGNSMGGRVAFEIGFRNSARVGRIVGLTPALAWLRGRGWTPLVKALRPELGLLQITPRPVIEEVVRRFVPGGRDGWSAVGVDEFLRAYTTARGRAAFYAALRHIYLDEPQGDEGFWTRLRELQHESLFVWGQKDRLVPIAFARHVREALPGAQHLELDCGHVPQLEAPRETHAAVRRFLRS